MTINYNELTDLGKLRFCRREYKKAKTHADKLSISRAIDDIKKRMKGEIIINMEKEKLVCYLDGDSLCVVRPDFINLQESPAIFLDLSNQDLRAIEEMQKIIKKEK